MKRRPWGSQKTDAQRERDRVRKEREWARKYHSEARIFYIATALECVVPNCTDGGDNDPAHTRTGGVGRKSDYTTIVPMCRPHHDQHHRGRLTFAERRGIDLEEAARLTEASWQTYGSEVVGRAQRDGRYAAWHRRWSASRHEQDDAA